MSEMLKKAISKIALALQNIWGLGLPVYVLIRRSGNIHVLHGGKLSRKSIAYQ